MEVFFAFTLDICAGEYKKRKIRWISTEVDKPDGTRYADIAQNRAAASGRDNRTQGVLAQGRLRGSPRL